MCHLTVFQLNQVKKKFVLLLHPDKCHDDALRDEVRGAFTTVGHNLQLNLKSSWQDWDTVSRRILSFVNTADLSSFSFVLTTGQVSDALSQAKDLVARRTHLYYRVSTADASSVP